MARWMVTGARGLLGTDLVQQLQAAGHAVTATGSELDIADPAAVAGLGDFEVLVNCAAYTAVDSAEAEEEKAFRVNAVGPQLLARAARDRGARIVQISTDYVFAGDGAQLRREDEALLPRSSYGRTKAAGEWAVRAEAPDHLIVRTAWLYGAHGGCFPRTIARLARERGSVGVVADQWGQPTWTRDLADLVIRLVAAAAPAGTYHGTAAGLTSWCGFAREVLRAAEMDPELVLETSTAASARAAPRPAFSGLSHGALTRIGVEPILPWLERWREAAPAVLQ